MEPWDCDTMGHVFTYGSDLCRECGVKVVMSAAYASMSAGGVYMQSPVNPPSAFPDVDAVLDNMAAMQRAQEMLAEADAPPDAIRVLAEQRGQELGVEVVFSRILVEAELRWSITVRTRRGAAMATPYLTTEQQVDLPIAGPEWTIEGWKNALRKVGLL